MVLPLHNIACKFRELFPRIQPARLVERLFLFECFTNCEIDAGARFEVIVVEVDEFSVEPINSSCSLSHNFIAVVLAVKYNCVTSYTIPTFTA